MPFILKNLSLPAGQPEDRLRREVCRRLSLGPEEILDFRLIRKGLDARNKNNIHFVCTVRFVLRDETAFLERFRKEPDLTHVADEPLPVFPRMVCPERIVIVGTGPAGIFAALRLAEYGLVATVLERGKPVEERVRDVQRFWSLGELDPESNVQFGEGGAGTFSDGKLTTRVNDPNIRYVLEKLVAFGAPEEIAHLAKPHIGSDRLRGVIRGIRQHLAAGGFDIRFGNRLTGLDKTGNRLASVTVNDSVELPCDVLVLAPGHSARDTYRMLKESGVELVSKPFAIGVRVEHPQELIDRIQYGKNPPAGLPPAEYALAWNDPATGRSCYSFCMCPGGVVVAGSSDPNGVVTNGMSGYLRDAPHANSALVVNVTPADFGGSDPLAGVEFQRVWERKAFAAGGRDYRAPAQNLMAFLGAKGGTPFSSYRPGVREAALHEVLPPYVTATLKEGLGHFDRKMKGFVTAEATLVGVETRTSAPLRILRGEDFQSVSLSGLYPAGEGAGYAGGIMSAALDGIRVADAIAAKIQRSLS